MAHDPPTPQDGQSGCCSDSCGCGPTPVSLSRRTFIAATTAAAGTLLTRANSILGVPIAGPFEWPGPDDFPIPADKRLDPAWVRSLTERGEPTVYRAKRAGSLDELEYIGMPVGGICCGQLYLGGDGKLWHWDIFNQPAGKGWNDSSGGMYAKPPAQASPIEQGFVLRIKPLGAGAKETVRTLDRKGFGDIEFRGTYPIGHVTYREPGEAVEAELEAFSPFVPLDVNQSGIPATVLRYTIRNTGAAPVEVELGAWLENPVCKWTGRPGAGARRTSWRREQGPAGGMTLLECTARPPLEAERKAPPTRQDIVVEDWEKGTYDGWTATGTAFGEKPRKLSDIAPYQGDLNAQGEWTVNTHETRHGEDVTKADTYIGTLTSAPFKIERDHLSFRIGGGNHPAQTCVNLLVAGAVVRTATGLNNNRMRIENWDVRELAGKEAQLQIVDGFTGGWGQVGCDDIVLTDSPREEPYELERATDYGSIVLSILSTPRAAGGTAGVRRGDLPAGVFVSRADLPTTIDTPMGEDAPIGALRTGVLTLAPGESQTITFALAWHFANPWRESLSFLRDIRTLRREYARRFADASRVLAHVAENIEPLTDTTRLWRDTWYDSTLPHWFLDRSFATVATAATSTCYRFDNGRFYGWEGTYCCAGTCTHVWQYAQALGRVFPELERSTREMIDFGAEFEEETGLIHYRGEAARSLAIDGQCGTILRAYREHTMSASPAFLERVWPRVKKAIEMVIDRDTDQDGILDGAQYNTLDTTWWGQVPWISSLYLAALRAGAAMAQEMGDKAFADRCDMIAKRGMASFGEKLFDGEYFVHRTDPAHPEANSTGAGCHSDQLFGQSYAHQLGLPRIVAREQSLSALRSIYKYCFTPDIGPYRAVAEKTIKGGRWYAMPGEGGMLMCTWPHGGLDGAPGRSRDAWAAIYFNECWTGYEHQVASHMLYEGLVHEGMAITRMLHDRHHASRRSPYNEVECSNHYARAMAGYGTYLGACGFAHHGPSAAISFDPKLSPDHFRGAFIGATGWGSYSQERTPGSLRARLEVRWGMMRVASLGVGIPADARVKAVAAHLGAVELRIADAARTPDSLTARISDRVLMGPGDTLTLHVQW